MLFNNCTLQLCTIHNYVQVLHTPTPTLTQYTHKIHSHTHRHTMHTHKCTHTHTQTHTHTDTHTHTHTHTHNSAPILPEGKGHEAIPCPNASLNGPVGAHHQTAQGETHLPPCLFPHSSLSPLLPASSLTPPCLLPHSSLSPPSLLLHLILPASSLTPFNPQIIAYKCILHCGIQLLWAHK